MKRRTENITNKQKRGRALTPFVCLAEDETMNCWPTSLVLTEWIMPCPIN